MSDLVGTTFAIQSVRLSNEVAGRIVQVNFESGQVVEQDQVLITLDSSSERADLAAAEASVVVAEASVRSARASLGTAQASLDLAHAQMRRLEPAAAARAASQSDLDRARADLDRARADMDVYQMAIAKADAEVLQSKARVDQIRALLAKMTLRAPFKARTGLRNIHPGQYIGEGTVLAELQMLSPSIYVDFAVPQEHASKAQPGMTVLATSSALSGSSSSASGSTEPVKIEVVAVDATANPATRNVRIRAIVDNPGERLKPGMFVDVRVPIAEEREYTVVPMTAVRRAAFGDHVFLIENGEAPDSMIAVQRFVTLGPPVGNELIVLEGLKPGDRIAGAGSFKLRDKGPVMPGVHNTGGATPAAGATGAAGSAGGSGAPAQEALAKP
jgi:membrane fusion protein, multidrug efflux system